MAERRFHQLEEEVIRVVDSLDDRDVQMKVYAQTYARHIVAAAEEAASLGDTAENTVRTQLLYVLSNLDGAPATALREIQQLADEAGVDISRAVREIKPRKPRKAMRKAPARKAPTRRRSPTMLAYRQQSTASDYERGFSAARTAVARHGFVAAVREFTSNVQPYASPEYADGFSNGLHEQETAYHRASVVPEIDVAPAYGQVPVVTAEEANIDFLRGKVLDALDNTIKGLRAGEDIAPMDLTVAQGVAEMMGGDVEDVMRYYIANPTDVPAHVISAVLNMMHTFVLGATPQELSTLRAFGAGFVHHMAHQDPTQMNPQANPGFVRTAADERLWARAKASAARSYRVGSPSYWRVANTIFHRMKAAHGR